MSDQRNRNTSFKFWGTQTGRIQTQVPNLGNHFRKVKSGIYPPRIRDCFAARAGKIIHDIDYSGIELCFLQKYETGRAETPMDVWDHCRLKYTPKDVAATKVFYQKYYYTPKEVVITGEPVEITHLETFPVENVPDQATLDLVDRMILGLTQPQCSCAMRTLMSAGCQCGGS